MNSPTPPTHLTTEKMATFPLYHKDEERIFGGRERTRLTKIGNTTLTSSQIACKVNSLWTQLINWIESKRKIPLYERTFLPLSEEQGIYVNVKSLIYRLGITKEELDKTTPSTLISLIEQKAREIEAQANIQKGQITDKAQITKELIKTANYSPNSDTDLSVIQKKIDSTAARPIPDQFLFFCLPSVEFEGPNQKDWTNQINLARTLYYDVLSEEDRKALDLAIKTWMTGLQTDIQDLRRMSSNEERKKCTYQLLLASHQLSPTVSSFTLPGIGTLKPTGKAWTLDLDHSTKNKEDFAKAKTTLETFKHTFEQCFKELTKQSHSSQHQTENVFKEEDAIRKIYTEGKSKTLTPVTHKRYQPTLPTIQEKDEKKD